MKRLFKSLLILLFVLAPMTFASAKTTTTAEPQTNTGKVTLYVFYGDGCPHCSELETYIKTNLKKNKSLEGKFDVKYYEVWADKGNASFLSELSDYFNYNITGVPFFMIGEKYYSGYGEQHNAEIEKQIADQSQDPNYKDVVAELTSKKGVTLTESNPEDKIQTEDDKAKENKKNDIIGYIILGVTVVILLLIIFTRRTDADVEEEEEAPKTTKKKNTKK